MLSLSKLMWLAVVAAGQVTFLTGMVVVDNLPYQFGQTIRLKVEPVDPRDMFRGDYVTLNYDFSRLSAAAGDDMPGSWNDTYGEHEVFILLKPVAGENYWTKDRYAAVQPTEGVYIRGRSAAWNNSLIRTGIEAYFVQEGQGLEIEDAMRRRRPVFAEVAVWRGTAKLKQVIVE